MKNRALALLAGILLLGLMPASASALPPTTLDQSNGTEAGYTLGSGNTPNLAQTFVAGKTGTMYGADLWMAGGQTVTLELHDVSGGKPGTTVLASTTATEPGGAGGWTHFIFSSPVDVVAGTQYALVFDTSSAGTVYGSSNTYAGGQAWIVNGSWTSITGLSGTPSDRPDWAFRTYVDTVGVALAPDKPQIIGGQTTTLTFAATITYTYGSSVQTIDFGMISSSLPTWFTPTGVTCPASVLPADCTVTNLGHGIPIPVGAGYDVITVTVTGTATPAVTDNGTTGRAYIGGCEYYQGMAGTVQPNATQNCTVPSAGVAVVAALSTPHPTAPPTSTGVDDTSSGPAGAILYLPVALLGFFGGVLLLVTRRRRVL